MCLEPSQLVCSFTLLSYRQYMLPLFLSIVEGRFREISTTVRLHFGTMGAASGAMDLVIAGGVEGMSSLGFRNYRALSHALEPASLTATSVKKMRIGLPSFVPRCSSEISSGPASL